MFFSVSYTVLCSNVPFLISFCHFQTAMGFLVCKRTLWAQIPVQTTNKIKINWKMNYKMLRWNPSNVAAWKMLEVAKRDEKANIAAKDCVAHWEEHRIDLLNPNTTTANQELPCSVTLWKQIPCNLFKNSNLHTFFHFCLFKGRIAPLPDKSKRYL